MTHEHPGPAGLQAERTGLAWTRTALAFGGAALLVTRYAVVRHVSLLVACGVVMLATAAGVALVARRRHDDIATSLADRRNPMNRKAVLLLSVVVSAVSLVCAVAVLSLR